MDIVPDPDTPDPADRTMQRLELTGALDDIYPQWRSMVGEPQRDGVPMGWIATDTVPAGVVLADLDEDEQNPVAVPLTWPIRRQPFYFLRTPEAPELWLRAVPEYPATFRADAALLTREVEPDRGVRQWQLLTADESPVQVAETAMGGLARPWLLRADASYDLELDIEGGWQVYGHHVPGGVVPRPGA